MPVFEYKATYDESEKGNDEAIGTVRADTKKAAKQMVVDAYGKGANGKNRKNFKVEIAPLEGEEQEG